MSEGVPLRTTLQCRGSEAVVGTPPTDVRLDARQSPRDSVTPTRPQIRSPWRGRRRTIKSSLNCPWMLAQTRAGRKPETAKLSSPPCILPFPHSSLATIEGFSPQPIPKASAGVWALDWAQGRALS